MRVVLYMNVPSPHQLPIMEALARNLGRENVLYVFAGEMSDERKNMGWGGSENVHLSVIGLETPQTREWLESADVMLTGMRDLDLFERRGARGLKTFYTSERWFKPRIGRLRLLLPRERLFHAGDWRALAGLLEKFNAATLSPSQSHSWSAASAAEQFVKECVAHA